MNAARRRGQGGFTLIELMIVISIIGIMVGPLLYLEIQSLERTNAGNIRRDLAESGARVLDYIARDARESAAAPAIAGEWRRGPDRLLFTTPGGGLIVYDFNPDTKTISRREYGPDLKTAFEEFALASDVRSFRVEGDDPEAPRLFTVRIDFHRELLAIPLDLTMKGVCARRLP